ncbi:MAG: right-handed parallel beta-helix repeat-containing protein, partial [Candidatus Glassbacteria bacterium]
MGNTITNNIADAGGGGILFGDDASPTIEGNTIMGNTAGEYGGGIGISSDAHSEVGNTILWNNNAPTGKEIYVGGDPVLSTLTIFYSDVEGGQASVYLDPGCTLNWLDGMIDADPMFILSEKLDCRLLWE